MYKKSSKSHPSSSSSWNEQEKTDELVRVGFDILPVNYIYNSVVSLQEGSKKKVA